MLKHVGRVKSTQRKVIVAYRTLPGDAKSCVVVTTENLEAADHDSLIKLVESNAGQNAYEFAEVMARSTLSDGSNMLSRFHTTGKMTKVSTDNIEMTPDLSNVIMLDKLNQTIAESRGVTVDELALKGPTNTSTTVSQNTEETVPPETTESNDILTDEQLAASYRSQADTMFKEAKRLRDEAEKLHPTKKKSVKKSVETTQP
jgi:hypothetical protein